MMLDLKFHRITLQRKKKTHIEIVKSSPYDKKN